MSFGESPVDVFCQNSVRCEKFQIRSIGKGGRFANVKMLRGELGIEPLREVDTLEEDHIEAEEGSTAGLCSLPAQGRPVSLPTLRTAG